MFSQASVCVCGSHVTITNDALDLIVHSLPSDMGPGYPPPPPITNILGGYHWRPVQTYSLVDLPCPPLSPNGHRTCSAGKRAVRILLECCLVSQ